MENNITNTYDLYHDIQRRTKGEIYIGVLGPVRTGKSTFIKRFMDVMVLPYMEDDYAKVRAMDELPQSAGGKTITTTEPKFIPKEAAKVILDNDLEAKVRLIDCVGYMVEGAAGHMEENTERMVKTPWFDYEIPFTQAAQIGTDKVMNEHSTIGLVVLTDGSFGEIPRSNYVEAEEKTIQALKQIQKPYVILLNSQKPYSDDTKKLAEELKEKYDSVVLPVNCEQLKKEDIYRILENVLYEFPISVMEFYLPKWLEMLSEENPIKQKIILGIKELMPGFSKVRDCLDKQISMDCEYISRTNMDSLHLEDGTVKYHLDVGEEYYYEMLTDMIGEEIFSEYQLLTKLKEFAEMKKEYQKVLNAMHSVRMKGYGVVMPEREEILLNQPEMIKHGNKYGVKMKASSPSVHMIKANIETEIAPIVGTQEQAQDLIRYIDENSSTPEGVWNTNIFGKSVEQLVNDGIVTKIASISDECQMKLQDTMQKIVNDSNGGMICIII